MTSSPKKSDREASSENYEALVHFSDELLGIVGFDGRLVAHNSAWGKILDLPRETPQAPDFLALIHHADLEKMLGALHKAAFGEAGPPVEVRCRRRDGTECWISWRVAAAAGGRRCRVAGRDVTSSKAIAQGRSDDRRMTELGLVAAVVAHDFNNVLSIIRGCVEMLRILPGLTKNQVRELDDLDGGVRHASELVQQVFAYSRKKPPPVGDVDLNKVVAQMDWLLRRLGHEKICVDLILGRNLGRVKAEEVQVEQVLFNLTLNARQAMAEGGRLLIETADVLADAASAPPLPPTASGGYVRLTVSDTGGGIPSEVQARLFEPFFTTKRSGTGLGLFSVQRIVQQCGGHIRIRSRPKKGTTFEVYFPRL